jgi:hypothetical protein
VNQLGQNRVNVDRLGDMCAFDDKLPSQKSSTTIGRGNRVPDPGDKGATATRCQRRTRAPAGRGDRPGDGAHDATVPKPERPLLLCFLILVLERGPR